MNTTATSTPKPGAPAPAVEPDAKSRLARHYGCGPIQFTGSDGLYERHLVFDNVMDPAATGPRERFEAAARSVRDVLSQRWVATEETYERANPKRIYYLSMEFLIGRSLANNVTNLLLDPLVKQTAAQKSVDWLELLEQEPDAGLGNGGLGRLAACFLDSMATMQLPAMGYGLRYEYGIFKQTIKDGWQDEQPDNWLRRPDPWEVARPHEKVEVKLNCSFELRGGALRAIPGTRVQPDRHSVRSARGRLRRQDHQHAAPVGRRGARLLRFRGIQQRRFRRRGGRDARGRVAHAGALSRRFHQPWARACASCRNIFWSPARWPTSCGASGAATPTGTQLPEKVAIQLNDTHPTLAVPELMRILLDEAQLGWDEAWDLTQTDAGLHEPHAAARSAGEMAGRLVRDAAAAPSGNHLRDQPPLARRRARPLPRRRGPGRARQPDRGRPGAARSAWPTWPSSARTAPTAWPRSIPSCCAR